MSMKIRGFGAALTAVIVAAAAIGSTSYGSSAVRDATVVPQAPAPTSSTTAVSFVQPAISSHFALFRNQLPDKMPEDVEQAVASPKKYGRNSSLARSIRTPYGTGWVIPGDGYLCLAVPDPVDGYGESCTTTDDAIQQGLWLRLAGDRPSDNALDTLVIPDGKTAGAANPATNGVVSKLQQVSDTRLKATSG